MKVIIFCTVLSIFCTVSGCAKNVQVRPESDFERCVKTVAGDTTVIYARLQAAQWCDKRS
jgi:hypothetical protein